MKINSIAILALLVVVGLSTGLVAAQAPYNSNKPPPFFKGEKKKGDGTVRLLQGTVKSPEDVAIEGAVVKIKDVKTLQVRSFISKPDGSYTFGGLSTNADYEIWADHQGQSSETRTLSVFDSRKIAIINLKVEPKKSEK